MKPRYLLDTNICIYIEQMTESRGANIGKAKMGKLKTRTRAEGRGGDHHAFGA
jgi:hypothetical protein